MKKILLSLIAIISFSSADSIYAGKCVKDIVSLSNNKINIVFYDDSITQTNYSQTTIDSLVNNIGKFYYDSNNNTCNAYIDSNYYGLTYNQFNFLMALTGLLTAVLLTSIIYKKV